MGNRDALVEGAKTCLLEKGYSRTTARDIATAAGVSLAAIGYHFGSKDTLLNEALRALLIDEWATQVEPVRAADAHEQFVGTWRQIAESLREPRMRALWAAQFEVLSLGGSMPELIADLVKMQGEAREGLAAMFGGVEAGAAPEQVKAIGAFLQALLLGVVAQSMLDPASAPTGEQLAQSLRQLAERISPSA
ncbi:TetR/AcrR family transcriptional regulator [Kribbella sp. NPDC059898]|uniref:TetR/AcrR family transcriptional regulator n=1 Tax=Kribbella sp. NPDC059898 TaxID=3346995 RepID=UPI0036650D8D